MTHTKIAAIFALVLVLSACDSPEEKAAKFYQSGLEFYEAGDLGKASIELRNAIQLNPDNADAYYQLALVNERQKKWQPMFSNLAWSIKLNPENYMAHVKMARLYLLSNEMGNAQESLEKALKINQDDIEIYSVRAAIRLKQDDIDGAFADIEKVLASQPTHENALTLKAAILDGKGETDKAINLLNEAIADSSDSLILHLLKIKLLTDHGRHDEVKAAYKTAIGQFPHIDDLFYKFTEYLYMNGFYSDAIEALEDNVRNNPDNDTPKLALISLLANRDISSAAQKVGQFLEKQPQNIKLLMAKADLLLKQKDLDNAIPVLREIASLGGVKEKNAAQVRLAQIDLIRGNDEEALVALNRILSDDGRNVSALELRAKILYNRKEYSQAISDLRLILAESPNADDAYILLAKAYLKTGAEGLAHDSYKQALEINPSNENAYMPIIGYLLENKSIAQAERVISSILEQDPNNSYAQRVLAQLKIMDKDWDGLEQLVKRFGNSQSEEERIYSKFLSARVWQEQKRCNEAIKLYKEVLEAQPNAQIALNGITLCYKAIDQLDQLDQYLDSFIQRHPKATVAYATSALLKASNHAYKPALAVLDTAFSKVGDDYRLYSTQAKVYKASGDMEKARESYKQGLTAIPDSLLLKVEMAMLLEEMGNYQAAITLYEQVLKVNPNVDVAINNFAAIIADYFPSDEKLQQAATLSSHFKSSKQPYFLDTYGWLQFKNGNMEEALIAIERASLLAPEIAIFQLHLGQIYKQKEQLDVAKQRLEDALALAQKHNDEKIQREAEVLLKTL